MSVRAAVTSKNEPRKEERKNKYAENAKRQGDKGLCRKETGYITSEIFGGVWGGWGFLFSFRAKVLSEGYWVFGYHQTATTTIGFSFPSFHRGVRIVWLKAL